MSKVVIFAFNSQGMWRDDNPETKTCPSQVWHFCDLPGETVTRLAGRTARKRFGQSDELRDFADFFRKGLASEFLAHFRFHHVAG
jgi:hypothetical protein